MDLNVIKQRLEKMNKQSSNSGGGGKNLFWKPSVGKQVVRVVPNKYNKSFPFTEMLFYYGIGPRVMASPQNWKEKDPIQEFTKQLRQSGDKLWQFGKEVYQEFLNMASDDEIGDYTDMAEGRDIKLTTVGPEVTGTPYNKTTIGPSLKTSPISNDSGLVQSILDNQPDPMGIFKKYTFDEVKAGLQEWLAPEDQEKEGEIISEPAVAFDSDKKTSANYSIDTSKQSKEQKFDDLFSDKKEESDDLPF